MHKDPIFKGRSLAFSSDLSIAAPLKRGLVPALDAVTYKTRAQRLLDTLHLGRMRNHEHAYARLFSDAVERVGVIQSVRVALLEPEDKLLLTVSFDGNWDAYIRTLWVKVGGLLDVIFCNTEGYVEARLHSCEAWAEWVRNHQVQTHFFYGSADGSATDLLYLRRQERLRQDRLAADPEPPPGTLPRAEQRARETIEMVDKTIGPLQWPRNEMMVSAMLRQGLQSLAGLHRLADWYVPGTPDGEVLHRAAHELLQDFVQAWQRGLFKLALGNPATRLAERFARQTTWMFGPGPEANVPPPRVPAGGGEALLPADQADVQGGIVKGYDGITHAALLMFAFANAAAGARFLLALRSQLDTASQLNTVKPGEMRRTLYLSLAGLRRLQVDDASVATLPEAFVQGMAARAGLLGDRHDNHPERWTPPLRHAAAGADERIDLAAVHAVVYVRINDPGDSGTQWDLTQSAGLLHDEIERLRQMDAGATLLAVEPLRRLYAHHKARKGVHEHFGYADGDGQPGVGGNPAGGDYIGNNQPLGEFLIGHPGRGDVKPLPGVPPRPERPPPAWLRNSSFLVVRKYRQWPDRFNLMLKEATDQTGLDDEVIAAKLMGRDRQGRSLVRPGSTSNQFTYLADPAGQRCPLHAHARRSNPRRPGYDMAPGEREPRILRRSISYGPRYNPESDPARPESEAGPEAERGLMFMAFNADIAEQFEVVQRWLTGGHATDTTSGISCPIVGVPEPGRPRRYEFEHNKQLARITLDGRGPLLGDAEPLVRLEWGAYWLAPSLSAIDHLATLAERGAAAAPLPYSADRGRTLIDALPAEGLGAARDWKVVLEDVESQRGFDAASLWAAVRRDKGGAMRCPMGVLVGSREAVSEVLRDTEQRTTVAGYAQRMRHSMGPIFLGLDDRDGSAYQQEARPVREAIEKLDAAQAYEVAFEAVTQRLARLVSGAIAQAGMSADPVYELVFDDRELVDEVLARLCECWFGLEAPAASAYFERGGFRWDASDDRPRYPGHFMAPSRYIFQPDPDATVKALGLRHGQAMKGAMLRFLGARGGKPLVDPLTGEPALVGQAVVNHPLSKGSADFAARTMVGAIMGFVPTMDGALRAVLGEWRRSGELARLRAGSLGARWSRAEAQAALDGAMHTALQFRCVPDMIWRRASEDFEVVPGVHVKQGEALVLGLGSAAQQSLDQGRRDDSRAMFGGTRDASGVPTHACPGYAAARAAMLGALAALVSSELPLQELPNTSSWRVRGPSLVPTPAAAPPPKSADFDPKDGQDRVSASVMCWGDSWLDYRAGLIGPRIDLLEVLQEHYENYTVLGRGGFASYATWGTIEEMAKGLPRFQADLRARIDLGEAPAAILLSGGGNDSTGKMLASLLLPYKKGGPYLKQEAVMHVDQLMAHYRTVLAGIKATCVDAGHKTMPVLLHGYDHPFPNWGISAWLKGAFESVGYDATRPEHWIDAAAAMHELIRNLNEAQKTLVGTFSGFAHHVDLQGIIADQWQPDARDGWDNELHPTAAGFRHLAVRIDAALQAVLRPVP